MASINGLPVAGYRAQTQEKVDIVNEHKFTEERLLRIIDQQHSDGILDGRWASIAKTHIEQAFMALNRAVFQPSRAKLPED